MFTGGWSDFLNMVLVPLSEESKIQYVRVFVGIPDPNENDAPDRRRTGIPTAEGIPTPHLEDVDSNSVI